MYSYFVGSTGKFKLVKVERFKFLNLFNYPGFSFLHVMDFIIQNRRIVVGNFGHFYSRTTDPPLSSVLGLWSDGCRHDSARSTDPVESGTKHFPVNTRLTWKYRLKRIFTWYSNWRRFRFNWLKLVGYLLYKQLLNRHFIQRFIGSFKYMSCAGISRLNDSTGGLFKEQRIFSGKKCRYCVFRTIRI